MKIDDFINKPIDEIAEHFELNDAKPILDIDGNIIKLIVEYVPKK